jgi:xylose dehydrogenase (NAD/NADP)
MTDVRWGVLGAGGLLQGATGAALHKAQGAQFHAIAARDPERARKAGATKTHDTYQAIVDDPDIEAVYICLSNDGHLPWIEAAIAAGKHVLCEKPMTLSAADAQSAFDQAEAKGVFLVEATWSRWHPRTRRIVDLATSGALGEITGFESAFTFDGVPAENYRLSRTHGGGALYDVGIYPLHSLFAVLPDVEDLEVVDVAHTRHPDGVDMTTAAQLRWRPETEAEIRGSFIEPERQTLTVRGTEGQVRITDNQAFTSLGVPAELWVNDTKETFPAVDAYQIMFEEVSAKIRGTGGWVLPPRDSLRVARTVDALL